jgi:beta-glucosidase
VLIGTAKGKPRHDFSGRLGFQWPVECGPGGKPLALLGAGWTYSAKPPRRSLDTGCALLKADFGNGLRLFGRGLNSSVTASVEDEGGIAPLANLAGNSKGNALRISGFDRNAQEDARRWTWIRPAKVSFVWTGATLPGNAIIVLNIQTGARPVSTISLTPLGGDQSKRVDLTSSFELSSGKGWRTLRVPLACLGNGKPDGVRLHANGPFEFELDSMGIVPGAATVDCKGPF